MAKGTSFIFFHKLEFDLDSAAQVLDDILTVKREDDLLSVHWEAGPVLSIRLERGESVAAEAAAMAKRASLKSNPAAPALASCDARFAITFDDLDEVLDEINTLIEVQLTLQQATNGVLFNTWNNNLSVWEDDH